MLRFLGAEDIDDLNSKASSTMEVLRLASPENNPPPVPTKKRKRNKKVEDNVPAKVSCTNAIWVDEQYSVNDSFKKLLTEVYQAEASNVNFINKKEEAVKEINLWAKKSTNGCINNILTPDNINKETSLVLTNAIYFKALWFNQFENCSNREDFHLINGINKVSVPFMHEGHTWFRYRKFDEFKRVKMKKVMIPEWKSSNKFKLKDTMQKLGLKLPFEKDQSDFTEMLHGYKGKEVYISEVIQSAYIDVDKNGTEAAAVTAITTFPRRSLWRIIHSCS
ncbi:At2g25240 [Linum perenne]